MLMKPQMYFLEKILKKLYRDHDVFTTFHKGYFALKQLKTREF